MCKSISQEMLIKEVKLIEKTGGKSDISKKNQLRKDPPRHD